MRRNVSLEDISDGRLYGYHDMVKADSHGCRGCHKCCTGMGNSIILDPYDVWRLWKGLGRNLSDLMTENQVELNVVDGCILPNLKMAGKDEACVFLDENGRCSIHPYRPGVCRLFPLGRVYENGDYKFFLQTGECAEQSRSKVKVSRWIDTTSYDKNHDFLCVWHYLLKDVESMVRGPEGDETARNINLFLLKQFFFLTVETEDDFYREFHRRVAEFQNRFPASDRVIK